MPIKLNKGKPIISQFLSFSHIMVRLGKGGEVLPDLSVYLASSPTNLRDRTLLLEFVLFPLAPCTELK